MKHSAIEEPIKVEEVSEMACFSIYYSTTANGDVVVNAETMALMWSRMAQVAEESKYRKERRAWIKFCKEKMTETWEMIDKHKKLYEGE